MAQDHESAAELEDLFGKNIANLVQAASKRHAHITAPTDENWDERKRRILAAIPHKSLAEPPISLADKLYNVHSPLTDLVCADTGATVWGRFPPAAQPERPVRITSLSTHPFATPVADRPTMTTYSPSQINSPLQ
jgi:hypothetical protein